MIGYADTVIKVFFPRTVTADGTLKTSQTSMDLSIRAYRAITAIEDGIANIFSRAKYAYVRRQTIKELNALDDWILDDIGIVRGEIPTVVDAAMHQHGSNGPYLSGTCGSPSLGSDDDGDLAA